MTFRIFVIISLIGLINCGEAADISCAAAKSEYSSQGFYDKVPDDPIPGGHLRFCSGKDTCCTDLMERKLSIESRQQFDKRLKGQLNPLASHLAKRKTKFDDLFRSLLDESYVDLDKLFRTTYGMLYEQNSAVFMDLYDSLRGYYFMGDKNLQEEMEKFFRKLHEKMFTVLNHQYDYNDRYLKCVTEQLESMKPFGDVPYEMTLQVKRSFVALRTFVQGLATGSDVVRKVLKVNPSITCVHELMKMTHCSICQGLQGAQPCLPYCLDVQNICLLHLHSLSDQWNTFIDAMVDIGDRLESSFKIEHVVQPINVELSLAIMNFQESGQELTHKIFQLCGQPRLGRGKREASRGELSLESLDFTGKNSGRSSSGDQNKDVISKLVREIKTKIKNSRGFWADLPKKMCVKAAQDGATNCWTGTRLGRYEGFSLRNITSHPRHSSEMDEQVFRLKVITSKLIEAYHGRDVSWIDNEWLASTTRTVRNNRVEGSGGEESEVLSGKGRYPVDDEDGMFEAPFEGSGDSDYDGSGSHDPSSRYDSPHYSPPYDDSARGGHGHTYHVPPPEVTRRPRIQDFPKVDSKPSRPPSKETPSGASKEEMSFARAIAVYLLPTFIMFLGSIG